MGIRKAHQNRRNRITGNHESHVVAMGINEQKKLSRRLTLAEAQKAVERVQRRKIRFLEVAQTSADMIAAIPHLERDGYQQWVVSSGQQLLMLFSHHPLLKPYGCSPKNYHFLDWDHRKSPGVIQLEYTNPVPQVEVEFRKDMTHNVVWFRRYVMCDEGWLSAEEVAMKRDNKWLPKPTEIREMALAIRANNEANGIMRYDYERGPYERQEFTVTY